MFVRINTTSLRFDGSGLMERDDWKNLGLANLEDGTSKVKDDGESKKC